MKLRRLAHVNLAVDDLEAARDFYGRLLGLPSAPRPADAGTRPGCWFTLGPVEVHLSLEPGADNATSRRHLAFEVEDLAAARAQMASAGLAMEDGRPLPGIDRFFVRDPAGNRLEFYAETVAAP